MRVFEQKTDILKFGFLGGNFQRKVDREFTCFSRPPALIEIPPGCVENGVTCKLENTES